MLVEVRLLHINGNSNVNLGTRTSPPINNDAVTKRSISLSNTQGAYSTYAGIAAKALAKDNNKLAKETLRRYIDRARAESTEVGKFNKDAFNARNSANYAEVAKVGGEIMGNVPDVTVSDLEHQIAKTITETLVNSSFQDIIVSLNKALQGIGAELVNRFADKGIIGVRYGEEGSEKGIGVNYEEWKAIISQIMEGLSNLDVTKLTSVFNYTRENLTSVLDGFIKQEAQVNSKIQALTQKIEENAKIIGTEFRTRKNLTAFLNKTNKNGKEAEDKLKELIPRKKELEAKRKELKPGYEEAEKKYKDDYNRL